MNSFHSFLRHDGDSSIHNMSPLLIFLLCLFKCILNCLIHDHWLHRHTSYVKRFDRSVLCPVYPTSFLLELQCVWQNLYIYIIYIILPQYSTHSSISCLQLVIDGLVPSAHVQTSCHTHCTAKTTRDLHFSQVKSSILFLSVQSWSSMNTS